jgi:hypothetical protein
MKTAALGFRELRSDSGTFALRARRRNKNWLSQEFCGLYTAAFEHSRTTGPTVSTGLVKDFSKTFEYHQNLIALIFVTSLSTRGWQHREKPQ